MNESPADRAWILPDEAVPIRLMATIWADASGVHDDLGVGDDLDAWLDAVGVDRSDDHSTATEVALALRLRDAVRRLAAQVTNDERRAAASATDDVHTAIRDVNDVVRHLPVPQLALADGVLRESSSNDGSAVTAGLARIAQESIALLGGADAAKLRACYAPGCVLYFVKTHPRREWCSVTCGNRARAARHYDKVRSTR
jgi:predicted RNA-binding Zn ribbon-like protein